MPKHISRLFRLDTIIPTDIPYEDVYRVHMLYVLVSLYIGFLLFLGIYALISPPIHKTEFRVMLISLSLIQVPTIYYLRHRKWDYVTFLLIIPFWLAISYGAFISGGVYASVTILYIAPLVVSIVLLGNRITLLLTLITIFYLFIMMILEMKGIVVFWVGKTPLFRFMMMIVVYLGVVAMLAYHKQKLLEVEEKNRQLYLEQEITKLQKLYSRNLSHDLRTPLSIIQTQPYLIRKRIEHGLPLEDCLQKIEDYAGTLTQMVADFAQVSEFLGNTDLQIRSRHPVDLEVIVKNAIEVSRVYNLEKEIQITFNNHSEGDSLVWGDSQYLQQMFRSLIHNSIRYGKQGGSVVIELRKAKFQFFVSVTDNGLGIAPDQHEKIFEPFYRADEARQMDKHTGSGTGLAIARRIVQLHHGNIIVQSELGKGSTFTVYLPAWRSSNG